MGRHLLRREILSSRTAVAAALCLAAALPASAEELVPRAGPPAEAPPPRAPAFERPARVSARDDRSGLSWHGGFPAEPVIRAPEGNALVRRYLEQYSSPAGRKWLEAVMRRGEPYLPRIRTAIAELGLPPELAYLPVVESGFLPTAVSKSGAVGLWQFMRNSVGPFGMQINDWTDDRRDFWKATDAALLKLRENREALGDWALALAAYNAGLGAVGRAVKTAGTRDYWTLCERKALKAETIHYVPKFIAVAAVLSRAGGNGIDLGWPQDPEWTRIAVSRTVDLGLLAEKAGIPAAGLRSGNPELRYGVTPPDQAYRLKVRAEHADAVRETLARSDLQLLKYHFHTVRSGDTLSALSRHYGVSVELIERSNAGLSARYLKLGAKILVPALKDVGPYRGERPDAPSAAFDGSHVVARGETLWSIALAHEVDPEALAEANGMELSAVLREGRVLKTPILKTESL